MGIVFIWDTYISQFKGLEEAYTKPSVWYNLNVVVFSLRDSVLSFRDVIRNKERHLNEIFIFESSWLLPWCFDVFFLKLEKFLMPNKVFIICYDPKGFTSSIPSVTPIEISCHCQLNLKYGSCDWLGRDFKLNVRNMTQEFVHFISIGWAYEPCCLIKFFFIQII